MNHKIWSKLVPLICLALFTCRYAVASNEPSDQVSNSIEVDSDKPYVALLRAKMDGSPEDETKFAKSDQLNVQLKKKLIGKIEKTRAKLQKSNLQRDLLLRLGHLNSELADLYQRMPANAHRDEIKKQAILKSNASFLQLKLIYPNFNPDSTSFFVAENLVKLNDLKTAEKYYLDIVNNYPQSSVVADSLLSLGNMKFEERAFPRARLFYSRILNTKEITLYPFAYYKTAWTFFNESEHELALQELEKSIRESRKLAGKAEKKLGVEEEALTDAVIFLSESSHPENSRSFFEKLVPKERSNELRFQLIRRLYEHGQHLPARTIAQTLLNEAPSKDLTNKLYLIIISAADRAKDRDISLATATKMSTWMKKENIRVDDKSYIESEEYMRSFAFRLHHEAETLKTKETWNQARQAYEIYLKSFPKESEIGEVKFRYAVLLMTQKEGFHAFETTNEALSAMKEDHPRYKECLKLRVQSMEFLSKAERAKIPDKDQMLAYDQFAIASKDDPLQVEARYKAAQISKKVEQPEQIAARFKDIAKSAPNSEFSRSSVAETLAVLALAKKWDALQADSTDFKNDKALTESVFAKDSELSKKLVDAQELAVIQSTSELETKGDISGAIKKYKEIESSPSISRNMVIHSILRVATLSEKSLARPLDAIHNLERLIEKFPEESYSKQAKLDLARLNELIANPRKSISYYLEFAKLGNENPHWISLNNAATLYEQLGERENAAKILSELLDRKTNAKAPITELAKVKTSVCSNLLLAIHQSPSDDLYRKSYKCSKELAKITDKDDLLWQVRAAWAGEKILTPEESFQNWSSISHHKWKSITEEDKPLLAMGAERLLEKELNEFKKLKFTKANEHPEANLKKKTVALESIEKNVAHLLEIGSQKQINLGKKVLKSAYEDMMETLNLANVPKALGEADRTALLANFKEFAKQFEVKAASIKWEEEAPKAQNRDLATAEPAANVAEEKIDLPSSVEFLPNEKAFLQGLTTTDQTREAYAKQAVQLFRDGKFGESQYFLGKWKSQLEKGDSKSPVYNLSLLEKLKGKLLLVLPTSDPLIKEL